MQEQERKFKNYVREIEVFFSSLFFGLVWSGLNVMFDILELSAYSNCWVI